MKKIFDLSYIFSMQPGSANLGFWKLLTTLCVILIVCSILSFLIARRYKDDGLRRHLWQRYAAWALTFSLVALVFAFFRLQNAYLLSMRAFIFGWILVCGIWLIRIVMFHVWKFPKKLRARDEKAFFEKYLPHKKK